MEGWILFKTTSSISCYLAQLSSLGRLHFPYQPHLITISSIYCSIWPSCPPREERRKSVHHRPWQHKWNIYRWKETQTWSYGIGTSRELYHLWYYHNQPFTIWIYLYIFIYFQSATFYNYDISGDIHLAMFRVSKVEAPAESPATEVEGSGT